MTGCGRFASFSSGLVVSHGIMWLADFFGLTFCETRIFCLHGVLRVSISLRGTSLRDWLDSWG